nr:PREDICTED: platelet-activating factor acetylhydrolase-like isoform X2 [Bemisia tabaci]
MWWRSNEKRHLPIAEGPYAPGCVDIMTEYSKEGCFVRFYYPTNIPIGDIKKEQSRWVRWMPHPNYEEGFASVVSLWLSVLKWAIWFFSGGNLHIPVVYKGAPLERAIKEKFKTVIFSHGFGASRFVCSTFCCELASRGFVVASVEHRDNSACATYYFESEEAKNNDTCTWIRHKKLEVGPKHYAERRTQIAIRSKECSQALDLLHSLNSDSVTNILDSSTFLNDFKGRLDLSSPTISGHSFGGATCLQTLYNDERFHRGVILDCWMFPLKDETHIVVKQPLLFLNSQTFHIKQNLTAMERVIKEPADAIRSVFTVKNTTHESQTDTPLVWGYWLDLFMKKLSPELALRIQNHLALVFLHQQLGPDPINDVGSSERFLSEHKNVLVEGLMMEAAQEAKRSFL